MKFFELSHCLYSFENILTSEHANTDCSRSRFSRWTSVCVCKPPVFSKSVEFEETRMYVFSWLSSYWTFFCVLLHQNPLTRLNFNESEQRTSHSSTVSFWHFLCSFVESLVLVVYYTCTLSFLSPLDLWSLDSIKLTTSGKCPVFGCEGHFYLQPN